MSNCPTGTPNLASQVYVIFKERLGILTSTKMTDLPDQDKGKSSGVDI